MVILGTVPDLSIVDAIAVGLAGKQLYLRFSSKKSVKFFLLPQIISVAKFTFISKPQLNIVDILKEFMNISFIPDNTLSFRVQL